MSQLFHLLALYATLCLSLSVGKRVTSCRQPSPTLALLKVFWQFVQTFPSLVKTQAWVQPGCWLWAVQAMRQGNSLLPLVAFSVDGVRHRRSRLSESPWSAEGWAALESAKKTIHFTLKKGKKSFPWLETKQAFQNPPWQAATVHAAALSNNNKHTHTHA